MVVGCYRQKVPMSFASEGLALMEEQVLRSEIKKSWLAGALMVSLVTSSMLVVTSVYAWAVVYCHRLLPLPLWIGWVVSSYSTLGLIAFLLLKLIKREGGRPYTFSVAVFLSATWFIECLFLVVILPAIVLATYPRIPTDQPRKGDFKTMRVSIELVACASVEMEFDDEQMAKIEEAGCPMQLDEFERLTGLSVDTEDVFTSHLEVADVNILPETKEMKEMTT